MNIRKYKCPFIYFIILFVIAMTSMADAPTHYQKDIHGWTVYIDVRLIDEPGTLGADAIALLQTKLFDVNRVLPEAALKRLREVKIWIDREHVPFPGAVYHPSADWLREHGHDPAMAGGVHIANVTNFLNWTREQPSMVIHELAHAYHHQVLGYGNEEIKAAYQRALDSGIYESVIRHNGEMQRAYGLNNEQEYFAECSEAWFGVNDFYPFVRAELIQHDPESAALIERLWNNPPDKPNR